MQINIRQARPKDWQLIQKLNNHVFQNDKENDSDMNLNWPFTEQGIAYYKDLANGTYGHCLIAEIGNEVVGYAALSKKSFDYRNSQYVELENIGVDPAYRSKGIGKVLMETIEKWARDQGADKLYVAAFWGNTRAIKYYKQNGFHETGIELEKDL
ncbi:MAG: GNAT family N-acetyltransferase [Microgenomates group bacterium]